MERPITSRTAHSLNVSQLPLSNRTRKMTSQWQEHSHLATICLHSAGASRGTRLTLTRLQNVGVNTCENPSHHKRVMVGGGVRLYDKAEGTPCTCEVG